MKHGSAWNGYRSKAAQLAAVLLLSLMLPGCPPCPAGFHKEVQHMGDGRFAFQSPTSSKQMQDSGQDVGLDLTYTFDVTGTFTLPDGRTGGPAGLEGVAAGEGAPAPALGLGAVIATVAGVDYYIGGHMKTTFSQPGRLMFRLNLPPDPPPTGPVLPPNAVTVNLTVSWQVTHEACVKNGEPPPPSTTWSQLYANYFAAETAGHCQKCHSAAVAGRPHFGTTSDQMYEGLQAAGLLSGGASARLGDASTSPIRWCSTGGTMPKDNSAANDAGCAAIRSWLDAGAQKN